MTQLEFDSKMHAINLAQYAEKVDIEQRIEELNAQKRELLTEIRALKNELEGKYIELGNLKDKKGVELMKIKAINCHYHDIKHQLIVDNPKSEMVNEQVDN